jgi:hypothetical protein
MNQLPAPLLQSPSGGGWAIQGLEEDLEGLPRAAAALAVRLGAAVAAEQEAEKRLVRLPPPQTPASALAILLLPLPGCACSTTTRSLAVLVQRRGLEAASWPPLVRRGCLYRGAGPAEARLPLPLLRLLLQVRWLYESSSLRRLQDDGLVLAGLEAGGPPAFLPRQSCPELAGWLAGWPAGRARSPAAGALAAACGLGQQRRATPLLTVPLLAAPLQPSATSCTATGCTALRCPVARSCPTTALGAWRCVILRASRWQQLDYFYTQDKHRPSG